MLLKNLKYGEGESVLENDCFHGSRSTALSGLRCNREADWKLRLISLYGQKSGESQCSKTTATGPVTGWWSMAGTVVMVHKAPSLAVLLAKWCGCLP